MDSALGTGEDVAPEGTLVAEILCVVFETRHDPAVAGLGRDHAGFGPVTVPQDVIIVCIRKPVECVAHTRRRMEEEVVSLPGCRLRIFGRCTNIAKIGRASCRARGCHYGKSCVFADTLQKNTTTLFV